MHYTVKQIAAMIRANVAAVDSGVITWEQFSRVNRETWDLATRGALPIIGTPASRRMDAVHRELRSEKCVA